MDGFSTLATIYLIAAGVWLLTIIITLIVIYRRKDLTRIVKYFWTFVIIIAPVLGLIAYFIWGAGARRRASKAIDISPAKDRRHLH
jgi:hypothetical protein